MKSWFIRGALALAIVPALAAAQQAAENARPITLDEAVKLAVQNSPTTVIARNAERTSEAGVMASKMRFLPSLSASFGATNSGGTQFISGVPVPISGLPWTYSRRLSSNLTVWDGGANLYNYKLAGANLDAAVASDVSARYGVALTVKQQYFNVLAAREQLAAAQRSLEQANQQLAVYVAKMLAGAATRADSLTGALQVGNAQLQILNAQNAFVNANAGLTRYVASPFPVTATPSDTSDIATIVVDEGSLTKMALEGPAIRSAAASFSASQASHRVATGTYWPSLTATGSYGQNPKATQGFLFGGGPTSTSTSFGLSLGYTIFNNYQREQGLVTARIAEDNAAANLRDAKFVAQQNLTSFLVNYQTAQQTIALQLLQITAATENLRVAQQKYNLGTALQVEITTAQATLDQARYNLINARLQARTAKASIEALIGRDLK